MNYDLSLPRRIIDAAVIAALEEDGAFDDVTTRALVPPDQWGRGVFVAKEPGVVCGLPVAAAAMTALDAEIAFYPLVTDGTRIEAGAELAEVEGPLGSILSAERVALNFLQRLSGIATLTDAYVRAVAGTRARILDTRKTTPGLRHLERYAVRCGGGQNHRFGLSSGVLIKDNHIAAARERRAGGLAAIVAEARAAAGHTIRVEIEVTTPEDAAEALEGRPDIVLLDNMGVGDLRRAVEIVGGRALTEASGGVTLANVRAIAETGVDYISVGRLTHSAPALDISLDVGEV
ncbi:MAG: carboxylating nicotinate-nucleotide diphosphorylase [Dehalococcoidia bacterium]